MKCLGCGYERINADTDPEWQCPGCKKAYNKFPDYSEYSDYEIILLKKKGPIKNETIKINTIYVSCFYSQLYGEHVVFGYINQSNEIRSIELNKELNSNYSSILETVIDPVKEFTEEQKKNIFTAVTQYELNSKNIPPNKIEFKLVEDISEFKFDDRNSNTFGLIGIFLLGLGVFLPLVTWPSMTMNSFQGYGTYNSYGLGYYLMIIAFLYLTIRYIEKRIVLIGLSILGFSLTSLLVVEALSYHFQFRYGFIFLYIGQILLIVSALTSKKNKKL